MEPTRTASFDDEMYEIMDNGIKVCAFCDDPLGEYPNDGYAHNDCSREFEIYESDSHDTTKSSFGFKNLNP